MKTYGKKLQITALCLLGASISASATAAETPAMSADNGWAQMTLSEGMNQKGEKIFNEVLHTTDASVAGTAFICVDKKLRVIAASSPQDMSEFIDSYNESKRQKSRKLSLSVGGTQAHESMWLYKYKIGFVKAVDRKTSAIIFNAAITGDTVELNGSGISNMSVTLPPPNSDFAGFGRSCGIGNNKKS